MTASAIPLVSVVMPVHNPHPDYFRQAVQSVLDQSLADIELVIVEDPAERSAREYLSGFHDPRIHYVFIPEMVTLVEKRNRCLAEARSDLVALLDADDVAEPHRLQQQMDFMNGHSDIGVLGSQIRIIDHEGQPLGIALFPKGTTRSSTLCDE